MQGASNGQIASDDGLQIAAVSSALIAMRDAVVNSATSVPGQPAGVFRAQIAIPDDCPTGRVPVSIIVGGVASPAVYFYVQ